MRMAAAWFGAMAWLASIAPGAAATEAESAPEGLTLRWALERASTHNPAIQAARSRTLAAEERPRIEGTLPDPTLGVRYHNEDWDLTFGASEFSFVEIGAEQEIPFPGKLGLRERMAQREAERERAMRDATATMVLGAVAARYAELAVAEGSREILSQSRALLELMVQQSSARYAVGDAEQQDVLRAAQERSALEERLAMIERRSAAARAALAALLDVDDRAQLPPTRGLEDAPPLRPLEELREKLAARSPELRASQEDLLRAGDALRLARRDYFPDIAVMAAYMDKERLLPEWELGVRIQLPLYFWRKQSAAVAEAAHTERAAAHAKRRSELDLASRLADQHAMAVASQRLVSLYTNELIPQADATLTSARASYAVRRVDFLTALSAFISLLEYRLRALEERGNLWQAVAEMAPIVGETPLGEPLPGAP